MILPSTIRLYSKKIPVRDAAKQFADRVKRHFQLNDICERESDDVEKSRFSQQEWNMARYQNIIQLDNKTKEPRSLLFFRGAIYLFTFNDPQGKFNQSQMCFLYDLPSQQHLNEWKKIKLIVAPPGSKEIIFDDSKSKQSYLDDGFYEVRLGIAPQHTHALSNNMQGRRKQYGLKHFVSSTIHGSMGDTLQFMATQISTKESNFSLWDKGQLVVILSRTKYAKNSIFVGPKNDTLDALTQLLLKKTQWTDYIEDVLDFVTINKNQGAGEDITGGHNANRIGRALNQNSYPFRICDLQLPIVSSGYVYMLLSLRHPNYTYIGTTKCIRTRIQMHNSGNGAIDTAPAYLRPFALFAYICGLTSDCSDLRYYIENKWKDKRDEVIAQGDINVKSWVYCANKVIANVCKNSVRFGVERNDLRLVCLFNDI